MYELSPHLSTLITTCYNNRVGTNLKPKTLKPPQNSYTVSKEAHLLCLVRRPRNGFLLALHLRQLRHQRLVHRRLVRQRAQRRRLRARGRVPIPFQSLEGCRRFSSLFSRYICVHLRRFALHTGGLVLVKLRQTRFGKRSEVLRKGPKSYKTHLRFVGRHVSGQRWAP